VPDSHYPPVPTLTRRDLLKGLAGAGLAAGFSAVTGCVHQRALAQHHLEAIRVENEKPGTTDWLLTNTRVDPKSIYRCPWIEGYCSRTSVRPGDSLDFLISTTPLSPFVIDLYRLGYYGGKGGRFLTRLGPFAGKVQPDPPVGIERLRECRWEAAATLAIPHGWLSGVYLGKLTAEQSGIQSYVIFIVRDDRPCDLLFQCSDTTWAAYIAGPISFRSTTMANHHTAGMLGLGCALAGTGLTAKCRQIFDAPLSQGSGEFLLWEFPLAFWMERKATTSPTSAMPTRTRTRRVAARANISVRRP
jgi:hypothetical protein